MIGLIANKLLSARFLVTIGLTFTACVMAFKGSFPMEAFTGLVTLAVRDYFMRDRSTDKLIGDPNATPK